MKKLILCLSVLMVWRPAAAADEPNVGQPIVWQTPIGTFGIPLNATEALTGYDGINKIAIAGFSIPVYADPFGILAIQLGAVAPWQTNGATIQPYVGAGHDIAREIPGLKDYKSCHINVFGRWDSENGRAGAGVSASYAFAGGALTGTNTPVPPTPSADTASIKEP